MFCPSPISAVDSYKLSHREAYPAGTTRVYNNYTPRSVSHLNVPHQYKTDKVVWYGGESTVRDLIEFWNEKFFQADKNKAIKKFKRLVTPFAGADYAIEHLEALHDLGYLPLDIRMLKEGIRVKVGIPTLVIFNTDDRFFWLTNYIESDLSSELWKGMTSATTADYYKKIALKFYEETGADMGFLPFAFHDFSYRGMSGRIDASKSGAGHLTAFLGTDTLPAVEYIEYHYRGEETFVGASVPAMEHSVQTAYGDDLEYFRRVTTEIYPKGIVSVVADGYDYWNVLTNVLPHLKNDILAREVNELGLAKVVIRPDSGDPVKIITGYTKKVYGDLAAAETDIMFHYDYDVPPELVFVDGVYYEYSVDQWPDGSNSGVTFTPTKLTEAEIKGSIEVLWETFGGTTNDKGYRRVNQRVGLIYGDSITLQRAHDIFYRLKEKKFSADNVVLGIGSFTYQYVTRDTLGNAIKATAMIRNGELIALFKDPVTDTTKTKKSAKGLVKVVYENGEYVLYDQQTVEQFEAPDNELKTFYRDGCLADATAFAEIRERLAA